MGPGGYPAVPNGITSSLQGGVQAQPGVPVPLRLGLSGASPNTKYCAAVQYSEQAGSSGGNVIEAAETLLFLL